MSFFHELTPQLNHLLGVLCWCSRIAIYFDSSTPICHQRGRLRQRRRQLFHTRFGDAGAISGLAHDETCKWRSGGWRVGWIGGSQQKRDTTKPNHNRKYMFGGWMWFRTEVFCSWKSLWRNTVWLLSTLSEIIWVFTHFHKEKGSHIYLQWQLRTSDFGDSAANMSDRKWKDLWNSRMDALECLSHKI